MDLLSCLKENNIEQSAPNVGVVDQEPNEIHRFELLRNELIELEKRVQRSAYQSENNEVRLKDSISYMFMILYGLQNFCLVNALVNNISGDLVFNRAKWCCVRCDPYI